MSVPMTAQQFLDQLKKFGVPVKEHAGWRTHNRNSKGAWGPLNGVMIHHTAGLNVEQYVYDGSDELPGPLCHLYISKDGVAHTIGWGRTNHAGGGDPDVLAAVEAETYPLPPTDKHQGEAGAVDGNAHFVGFECENKGDGKDPWPTKQLDTMARASAAVCDFYGWSVNSVIRHLDWSDWKSDPKGVDWTKFRASVSKYLAAHGTPAPTTPKPTTPPAKPVVDLSNLIAAAKRDPGLKQGGITHSADVKPVEAALVKIGYLPKAYAADGSFGSLTRDAYARWQRYLGYTGAGADGIPGKASLTRLGLKTGLFTIKD